MNETAKSRETEASNSGASDPQLAGLIAFAQQRKHDSRERLLLAGLGKFCDHGYHSVSIEDIATAAGMSRVTFYRHFGSKADLAIELFNRATEEAMPRFLRITQSQYRDRAAVSEWITSLFEANRSNRRLLRVFTQATVDEDGFTKRAQELISRLIARFGTAIPAFNVSPDHSHERRRWVEAWLLIFEILDQSNHAALDSGVATDPLVIDVLTDRFVAFVA